MNLRQARAALAREDRRLDVEVERRSLAPDRATATPLTEIVDALPLHRVPEDLACAFMAGIVRWTQGQSEHFPENIFWDFDFPLAAMWRGVASLPEPDRLSRVEALFVLLLELQRCYGVHSTIRFRYVHDFTYGLDWAKWVGREPAQDGSVGPFDWCFLRYLERRAEELVALIAADDQKYPTLRDAKPRNPFSFRRDPSAEQAILGALAAAGELPVQAWSRTAVPVWDRPFQDLRVAKARALGLLHT